MVKEVFEKLKGNNGSPVMVSNLKVMNDWQKTLETDAVLKELSMDPLKAGILYLSKSDIMDEIVLQYPVKSKRRLSKKYTQGRIDADAVSEEVHTSWLAQLDAALKDDHWYYVCWNEGIRLHLEKAGSKGVENHASRVKDWNINHGLELKQMESAFRRKWSEVQGDKFLFFGHAEEARVQNQNVSKSDVKWDALWNNVSYVVSQVLSTDTNDKEDHVWFQSTSAGTKAGTTEVYLQWSLFTTKKVVEKGGGERPKRGPITRQ